VTKLIMVCHGNICRSPMAERVLRRMVAEQGLDVQVTSAGVSDEERGNPIDPRAVRTLTGAGYDASDHVAHRITAQEVREADLVVAAEQYHLDRMRRLVPEADNLHLFSEYDPQAAPGDPLPDPWYGGQDGFTSTLEAIERAAPHILRAAVAASRQ